jgi:cyanophycinase
VSGGLVLALLGSGEFEPWAAEVDRWLLERSRVGDGRVLVLPTASAHEGDEIFDGWARRGLAHYASQGISAEVVPIKSREDADRLEHVRELDRASMVFFSGGNPARLASVMRDSAFWRALLGHMRRGLAYGGCSAGVACLPELSPDSDVDPFGDEFVKQGLGLFTGCIFAPHWDALDSYVPGITERIVSVVPRGLALIGLDEHTAMMGDGHRWSVAGRGRVHLLRDGTWEEPEDSFDLTLVP